MGLIWNEVRGLLHFFVIIALRVNLNRVKLHNLNVQFGDPDKCEHRVIPRVLVTPKTSLCSFQALPIGNCYSDFCPHKLVLFVLSGLVRNPSLIKGLQLTTE